MLSRHHCRIHRILPRQALYRRFTAPTTNQAIPEGCPACSSTKVKDYTPCLDCPKCHFVSSSFSPFCPSCDSLQPPKPNACPVDYFQLLDQPHKFNLDTTVAEQSYRKWQTRLHPDKLASVEGADTDVAAAHSALVNDAINVLRSPLRRAVHLLELHAGINVDSEGDESKPEPSVLVEMFQYNEEIDDADGDEEELERITRENNERLKACEARLVTLCDEAHDWDAVKKEVNRMKFLVAAGCFPTLTTAQLLPPPPTPLGLPPSPTFQTASPPRLVSGEDFSPLGYVSVHQIGSGPSPCNLLRPLACLAYRLGLLVTSTPESMLITRRSRPPIAEAEELRRQLIHLLGLQPRGPDAETAVHNGNLGSMADEVHQGSSSPSNGVRMAPPPPPAILEGSRPPSLPSTTPSLPPPTVLSSAMGGVPREAGLVGPQVPTPRALLFVSEHGRAVFRLTLAQSLGQARGGTTHHRNPTTRELTASPRRLLQSAEGPLSKSAASVMSSTRPAEPSGSVPDYEHMQAVDTAMTVPNLSSGPRDSLKTVSSLKALRQQEEFLEAQHASHLRSNSDPRAATSDGPIYRDDSPTSVDQFVSPASDWQSKGGPTSSAFATARATDDGQEVGMYGASHPDEDSHLSARYSGPPTSVSDLNLTNIPEVYQRALHAVEKHGYRTLKWSEGWTALHWAAQKNHYRTCQYLLYKGADPNASDARGRTPVEVARNIGNRKIVQLFDRHREAHELDDNVEEEGVYRDVPEQFAEALRAVDVHGWQALRWADGWTALHWAAQEGRDDIVSYLLARNGDPSAADAAGKTPLDVARESGHSSVLEVLERASGRRP
ncbi:hypothetical protein FOZ60_009639 [Perkinsus olseni]|uniref:Co-chaperone HscB C-terminal oligomerisation domain-containing protein n=1 Tax=Perkinsus olseni TaxID=32597 RepID=A0A7J6PDP9_PEROL|nr:hypothetical protein FOZ60_009639 [Perkinsus olseni]